MGWETQTGSRSSDTTVLVAMYVIWMANQADTACS
jgi:hypothetical protein